MLSRIIQSDLSNGASFRGTAVPAVITGGTPVPRFMSLCIVSETNRWNRKGGAKESGWDPHMGCHSEPFAVILSPSLVILSGAKNLALPLRVDSAKSLS